MASNKKPTPAKKPARKPDKKTAKVVAQRKATPSSNKTGKPLRQRAAASGTDSAVDQEPAVSRVNDASDLARDQRLRKELEDDSGRSPSDRHRERLTAVEAEEDGVRDDDDDGDNAADQREEAISEQDADDERA